MSKWTLGIIGGSGLYEIDGLEDRHEKTVDTPWGAPSDALDAYCMAEARCISAFA